MIEKTLERIAAALEAIAKGLNNTPVIQSVAAPAAAPATPTPAPTAAQPFNSQAEVQDYVKKTYMEMGPEKGSKIITIMQELGVSNIKDLAPEHYAAFHQKVEALRNA